MSRFASILISLGLLFVGGAASAQTATARAGLSVVPRGVSVAALRPMQLQTDRGGGAFASEIGTVDTPAMIHVGGDANRNYHIRLPAFEGPDAIASENLGIWSRNAGDISKTGVARMDSSGRDLLWVTGWVRSPTGDASAPPALRLSIDYD